MKFRVSPKDLMMFILYSIFLLILCSLAVLNLSSLLNEGKLFGLNFFAGFFPPYLWATLLVFLAVLIAIFFSISSSIFDHEKGFGIGLKIGEKDDEKGYTRFATEKEMKNADDVKKVVISNLSADGAGVPLVNDGKDMWVDDGSFHSLVIGSTGNGKSQCVVEPMIESLGRKGESMIITDPKGELYRDHANFLRSKGYNIITLNFRDPQMGNAWNPLAIPYDLYKKGNEDKAIELLKDVSFNMVNDPKASDPFWGNASMGYFNGLALGLFQDAEEKYININSINYMAAVGEESFAPSNYATAYFDLKGKDSTPYNFAKSTITGPTETRTSVLSVFSEKMEKFTTQKNLSEMLSYSDFDMRSIGQEKTALFVVIHDEKTTYHPLATIFLKQAYEVLVDVAHKSPKGKLPIRTNFILDEFANMPPLKDVTAMVSAARSRNIRFTFIIQGFSQLNDVYGKEQADTIKGNCGNKIFINSSDLADLEEISKLCGEAKSKEKEKTASRPLLTSSDLQKLKKFQVVILRQRMNPFKTKLTPSFQINWGHSDEESKFIERKPREVSIFDFREFVREEKKKKLFGSIENNGGMPNQNGFGLGTPIGNIFEGLNKPTPNNNNPFSGFNNSNNNNPFGGFNNPFGPTRPSDENLDKTDILDVKDIQNQIRKPNINPNLFEDGQMDIDSLVKKIDAKIAELEKEEAEEKAKQNNNISQKVVDYDKLDTTMVEKFDDFFKKEDNNKVKEEPKVVVDKDSVVVGENNDDEYFDDFFNE